MLTLEFRFPAGRYHATPWDRHVNEGEIDWPPSPWRLVRALQAVWLSRAQEDIPQATATRLVETLAGHLPSYQLPPASSGHTRHFMSLYRTALDGKTNKVFDTFASVSREEPLVVTWPDLLLDPELEGALDLLLERLTWLGRSESWVTARRIEDILRRTDVRPAKDRSPGPGEELVRLLCPRSPQDYHEWADSLPRPKGKKPPLAPETLFEALTLETEDLRKAGWNQPPGGRWVEYLRPLDRLDGARRTSRQNRSRTDPPRVARFALASNVLPDLTETLRVGETIHKEFVRLSDGHPTFTGRNPDGSRREGHQHAHFLGETGPRDGQVRYLTLWAPEGLDEPALRALGQVGRVFGIGSDPIHVVLLGTGQPEDFSDSRTTAAGTPILASGTVWQSLTPFVPTRHPRARGTRRFENGLLVGSPEHDLRRLLALSGLPEPTEVTPLKECRFQGRTLPWARFRTQRLTGEGLRSNQPALGWRLVFPTPVQGPICLGYGSHFGLGLFVPQPD
jgi:CRISPR-associated protein Csb2